jgi:hypothetical protein
MKNETKFMGLVAVGLAVALSGVACGGESSSDSVTATLADADGANVTTVSHDADGKIAQTTVWMTKAEITKMSAERERLASLGNQGAAAALDTSCAGASFWIYDGYNQTGDIICFSGPAYDYTGDFYSPQGGTWYNHSKSYWAGSHAWAYFDSYSGNGHWTFGSAYARGNVPTTMWIVYQY